jgi:AbrB family looped-hinge helix DNA binding protein
MKTVTMSANGRLTLPIETRRQLGLSGETEFEVEVVEGQNLTLRPLARVPREDAWAYTAEHRELLAKAFADFKEGRARQLAEEDLAEASEDDPRGSSGGAGPTGAGSGPRRR